MSIYDYVFTGCRVDGCGGKPIAHHLCQMHYSRMRERGSVNPEPLKKGGVRTDDTTAAAIVRAVRAFENPQAVARRFGVSHTTVQRIMKDAAK